MLARSLTSRDEAQPADSLKALDWLNFFLAALLVGFGPFVAVHLAESGWAPASVGANEPLFLTSDNKRLAGAW